MKRTKLFDWLFTHRHPIFLVGLLTFFILPEVFEKIFHITFSFKFFIAILIISSMLLIHASPGKRFLSYALVASLIIFLFIWNRSRESSDLDQTGFAVLFIYFSFISFFLFRDLMQNKKITGSVIIGAFAGYFMIGVIYFFIFAFLDNAYPDTISVDLQRYRGLEDMFYFSFITLTTIGYGDFAPTSILGQKIAILEGLIGQFYIAIVMAILVGKFLSRDQKD